MSNLWEAATIDPEQERFEALASAASIAVAGQQGFVLQASSKAEFDDRVALVSDAVISAVSRLTYEDQAMFPVVHQAVLAGWERDFDIVTEARQVETQRQNARRAFFRRQAGSRWTIFPLGDSRLEVELLDSYPQELKPETGFFIAITRQTEERYYGRLSGRTVQKWNMACPTIELYRINTVVIDGAIWGVRGDRVPGTWAIRPEASDEVMRATASRKVAWTEDESDVTPMARKLMQMTDAATDVDKWNYGPDGYRDEVETALVAKIRPLLSQITQADIDCLEDYNFHVTNRAIDRAKGRTASAKSDEYAKTLIDDTDDSDELIDWKAEKKKREGGFKVVDDESGASSGTVYPNKQIADQADYGEGYSVQYTEDTVKTASWERTGGLWVSHTGSRVMEVAEVEGRFVWGAYRTDDSVIAEGHAPTLELAKSAALKTSGFAWKHMDNYGWYTVPADSPDRWHWANIDVENGVYVLTISDTSGDDFKPDKVVEVKSFTDLDSAKAHFEKFVSGERTAKTAGENPFAKKDDDKAAPKDDTTDSDKDGEQDGPTQPGEQREPAGDDAKAAPAAPADPAAAPAADPAAQAPADQQQAPVDPNAPQADPAAVDATGQDKGQAQDPASTSDAVQDQQQPADPTVMDVGQSTSMGFTMVEGGSSGSIEVTFVREENGVYFFNGPTGEFGVGQMNGQWQDADGNTFTFGGASPAPQGIGPAQEQAAAADAATPVPTPAGNAQAAPQGAQPAAAPPVAAPAKDDSANPADTPAPDAEKKDAPPAKDDGEKKENPFAKKSARDPKVHTYGSTSEAYDDTQTNEDVSQGDVLLIPSEKVVGFLLSAWPVAVTKECGNLHEMTDPSGPIKGESYDKPGEIAMWETGRAAAKKLAQEMGFPLA